MTNLNYLKIVSQIFDKFHCYYFIEFSLFPVIFLQKNIEIFDNFIDIFPTKKLYQKSETKFSVNEFGNILKQKSS